MDFYSVLGNILEEVGPFELLALLLLVGGIYYFFFAKRLVSLLDPLTYVVLFSAFTSVLLTVLVELEVISRGKFFFSVATLVLYYAAFLWISRQRKTRVRRRRPQRSRIAPSTMAILFCVNGALLLATYVFFGIPILLESRLSLFANAAGFGVIGRLTGGLEFASLLLGLIVLRRGDRRRAWGYALVVQFVVSAILSGSKGSLFGLAFAWYLAGVYLAKSWRAPLGLSRSALVIAATAIGVTSLVTITVQGGGEIATVRGALSALATRIAAEGDGYVYFFGANLIDTIARHDLLALFRPILTGLRLVPLDTAVNPGFEVIRELLSVDTPSAGPNSRLPIYILFFYGWPGLLLVPLLGAALGVARNAVFRAAQGSVFRYVVVATVYLDCTKFEVDPQITMNGLFDLVLVLPVLWIAFASAKRGLAARPKPSAPPTGPGSTLYLPLQT